ncbi:DUF3866 family protein [Evansella halocellulosilytica]|uniref:DUF3866 family protein n=1 Tax=Evansella halocellulosilytica TaxID=2011013 RepID=UPI000BB9A620|nr:DUF3866 family protein [Evansella halocellulosilytica]
MLFEEKVEIIRIISETEDLMKVETTGGCGRALIYKRIHGGAAVGDRVIVNTTATALRLGTGGWDIVRYIEKNSFESKAINDQKGHIVKARYLSDQHSVMSIEAPESEEHHIFDKKFTLNGKEILIGELHSIVPVIWFLLKEYNPHQTFVVIFSDEASLPLMMSEHLQYLKKQPSFLSITTGQSFGGQIEAVNIVTALQYVIEKYNHAVVLISLGPGVVGTSTPYGFSGIAQAQWANIVQSLNGVPVWIPRLSAADKRNRHKGISHHTYTPLTEFTYGKQVLPVPFGDYSNQWLDLQLNELDQDPNIQVERRDEQPLFQLLSLIDKKAPFPIKTMGRSFIQDNLFFLGIAAALDWHVGERKSRT